MNVRAHRRRPSGARSRRMSACSRPSLSPKLAKLRMAVLDHLKELEIQLSQLESPLREMVDDENTSGDQSIQAPPQCQRNETMTAIDDARARIGHGLEMLDRIRSDVCSHLPDLSGLSLDDVRSHIPSFEFRELELHLPSTPFTSSLDDVSFGLDKLQYPLSYLPKLTNHLESLHEHILSLQLPSSISFNFTISSRISELLFKLQDPDLFTDPLKGPLDFLGDSRKVLDDAETIERQTLHGLIKSHYGKRLILYQDLPLRYQNDEFVLTGYRFIPLSRWPFLVLSIFQLHNETVNIWSHLVPLLLSLSTFTTHFARSADLAEHVFVFFANLCLTSSCVWHIMAGCSHLKTMETAARVDYVGIGWLISASIGSVVYYGFGCRPQTAALYLCISLTLGITGSILPFMAFFNERQNKKWRIVFFLSLVFTLVIPLAHLSVVHSLWDMYTFMRPEFPSLAAYAIGLGFYTFHFPECVIPIRWTKFTDWFGGGSHAIWHIFIVLAIKLHKDAMIEYRTGIGGETCTLSWGGTATT